MEGENKGLGAHCSCSPLRSKNAHISQRFGATYLHTGGSPLTHIACDA